MTTGATAELTNVETIFKSLVWDKAIDAGLVSLYTAAPALAVWPFSNIIKGTANALGNYLFSGLTVFVDVSDINLKNKEMQTAYVKASVTLQVIAHDKGVQSNEFINAREAAKDALSKFVIFTQ